MIQLGLVGFPLGHSLSPRIHAAALHSCGLEGMYSLFPFGPDDRQGLKELLLRLRAGEIQGLNVTIPHKQNVIPLLDGLTSTAEAIGAVNTIYVRDDRLIGDNTDAQGFRSDLQSFLTTKTRRHGELNALVLGAGGSARAVVYALLKDSWNVTLAARRIEQAQQISISYTDYRLLITDFTLTTIDLSNISLIVNTTPIGMVPNIDQSPWPAALPFPPHAAVYDLVYNPQETKLIREACLQGLPARTGLGMLIEQAALSFEIWTGQHPEREPLFEAINHTAH